MQWSLSNRFSTATIALPTRVSVQLFWFLPKTELIVSCTFPNLYQLEVIKQRLNKSLQTEFPIWSIQIAMERIIEERYQSPFSPALLPLGKRNLTAISPSVHNIPSGNSTLPRAIATTRRDRLLRSLSIIFLC
nr:MAG TPA: hypothetical protein [Caudoviricetes sp.]